MSAPSKSIDKNKRYVGIKANDFVTKARTNETSRAAGMLKSKKTTYIYKTKLFSFL